MLSTASNNNNAKHVLCIACSIMPKTMEQNHTKSTMSLYKKIRTRQTYIMTSKPLIYANISMYTVLPLRFENSKKTCCLSTYRRRSIWTYRFFFLLRDMSRLLCGMRAKTAIFFFYSTKSQIVGKEIIITQRTLWIYQRKTNCFGDYSNLSTDLPINTVSFEKKKNNCDSSAWHAVICEKNVADEIVRI